MSIEPTAGILDIRNAIVRVSKLEFSGSTGFDTILNNVARNTVLLVDRNVEYTSSNSWALKLPNAWVAEFDAYWASGASGNIDFNVYNNVTSGTNGYTISMDDTTITVAYDGGSALATATLGSTLKNDTWRKIHVLFERDMISVALDGVPVLYFKDTLLRPRVYDENSGYIVASGLSADRKFKNIRVVNGDKWITDGTSNIAYVHGNVGIGTKTPEYTLDVKGDVRATGNLLIEGLTTTVGTQNLSIEDAIVEIGRGNDGGTSGKDVGFLFTRNNGSDTTNSNVALIYDESTDRLTFGYSDGGPTDSTLAINTSKSLDVVIPSGNVGVGTASPGAKLDVYVDNANNTSQLFIKNASASNRAGLSLINSDNEYFNIQHTTGGSNVAIIENFSQTNGGISFFAKGDGRYQFMTTNNNTTRMVIQNNGNVGIGTVTPLGKLTIGSSASGSSDVDILGFRSINNNAIDRVGYIQRVGFYSRNEYDNGDRLTAAIDCIYGDNVHYPTYPGLSSTNLAFTVTSRSGGSSEAMRIQHDGNVGIGTGVPVTKLHAAGKTVISENISTQDSTRVYDADLSVVSEIGYYHSGSADIDIGATTSQVGNYGTPYRYKLHTDISSADASFKIGRVAGPSGTYSGYGTVDDFVTLSSAARMTLTGKMFAQKGFVTQDFTVSVPYQTWTNLFDYRSLLYAYGTTFINLTDYGISDHAAGTLVVATDTGNYGAYLTIHSTSYYTNLRVSGNYIQGYQANYQGTTRTLYVRTTVVNNRQ